MRVIIEIATSKQSQNTPYYYRLKNYLTQEMPLHPPTSVWSHWLCPVVGKKLQVHECFSGMRTPKITGCRLTDAYIRKSSFTLGKFELSSTTVNSRNRFRKLSLSEKAGRPTFKFSSPHGVLLRKLITWCSTHPDDYAKMRKNSLHHVYLA